MSHSQHVPYGQDMLWRYSEFTDISLGWHIGLDEFIKISFFQIGKTFLSSTYLNSIITILLFTFNTNNLTSIHMQDSQGNVFSPFVKLSHHSQLISNQPAPSTIFAFRFRFLNIKFQIKKFLTIHCSLISFYLLPRFSLKISNRQLIKFFLPFLIPLLNILLSIFHRLKYRLFHEIIHFLRFLG